MTLRRDDYLESLRRDGEALLAAAAVAGLDAGVPGCPGWRVADLLHHVGEVAHFWGTLVRERLTEPSGYVPPARPDGAAVADWCRDRHAFLLDALRETPDDAQVWTWSRDHRVGFVVRRMAHEVAVHRVDAEQATGRPGAIEPELASDGIDELLDHFVGPQGAGQAAGGSVHVHCTDVAGEWLLRFEAGGPVLTREHAKGDVALRGPASDLLLALWRRRPLDAVEVIGDAGALDRFWALTGMT
jgi:uncharacterized protein (TIGR03083 family)